MSHDTSKQRIYKVTWREPPSSPSSQWSTKRANVVAYSVEDVIAYMRSYVVHADGLFTTIADHGQVDYQTSKVGG